MDLGTFVNTYNGTRVGTGQCVALIKQYESDVLGLTPQAVGNAHDYYDNFENTPFLYNNFTKIPRNGSNTPQPGDVVVWNTNVGDGYGHIDIAYMNISTQSFTSFAQNWNSYKKCSIDSHTYNNVSGWLRPNNATPYTPPTSDLLRNGIFGDYYGNYYTSSQALTEDQMKLNAQYILLSMQTQWGWSLNAIAGMLGNMEIESTINPGRWQSDDVGNLNGGYGLVQWTPAVNYIDWVRSYGYDDYSAMDLNIGRINYERENGLQWIPTSAYNFSFEDFLHSDKDPKYLASAFLKNYERAGVLKELKRRQAAQKWYEFLSGQPIPQFKEDEGYKFILFNGRKRRAGNGR